MSTPVKVKKWGSSMAVLIPGQFAKIREIEIGSVVDLESLTILKPRRRLKASELIKGFKTEHRQGEWELGGPVGKEAW